MGRLIVAGLGPGEIAIFDPRLWDVLGGIETVVFRTEIHPGISSAKKQLLAFNPAMSLSSHQTKFEDPGLIQADPISQLHR